MTEEEILNISEGRELDTLIAEQVMGWHLIPSETDESGDYWRQMWLDENNKFMHNSFEPSINMSHAWEIVEKMENDDVSFSMADVVPNSDPIVYEFKFMKGLSDYYSCEFTAPLTICRAALLLTFNIKQKF